MSLLTHTLVALEVDDEVLVEVTARIDELRPAWLKTSSKT
jgi:hypothetical protein